MFRTFSMAVALFVLLFVPVHLLAGGPPRLCLPVDGVTTENADACAKRVAAALGKEVINVDMRQNEGQWYLMFHFHRDRVRLADIDVALKGSPFSVARDKLRLFGDVMLEVDLRKAAADKLLADLKALKHVSVSESKREEGVLLVTLAMPQPARHGDQTGEFGQIAFTKEILQSSEGVVVTAKLHDMPTYEAMRKVVEKHEASLTGLRWEDSWACRVLGCVAARDAHGKLSTAVRGR